MIAFAGVFGFIIKNIILIYFIIIIKSMSLTVHKFQGIHQTAIKKQADAL